MVPILRHIVITDFHPVLVAASSSTVFILLIEYKMYLNTTPSQSSWNYLSNESSYAWNGLRTRELCLFYSGEAICPRLLSDCAALNDSAISPCTGLQNWWFLMRWKGDLKDPLNINFSSIVHLSSRGQILMETATSLSSLVDDQWPWLQSVKNSWEHFVMPAKQIKCTFYPPGWWSGVETIANKPNTSQRS
jgi:hypothetical protein